MKKVIINADDFGLSHGVNGAVEKAFEFGTLTSASIMANMPYFDEAVSIAKKCDGLGVGVHVNLLRGTPISNPSRISSLVNSDGKFYGSALTLLFKSKLGLIDPLHVEIEASAQMERVIRSGIKPTHFDSEKHMHIAIPAIWDGSCKAAVRHGILHVRLANEYILHETKEYASLKQRFKAGFARVRSRRLLSSLDRYGLSTADYFYGISSTGRMNVSGYRKILEEPFDGTIEIMCHPSIDKGGRHWLDAGRWIEYSALISDELKAILSGDSVLLVNYGMIF